MQTEQLFFAEVVAEIAAFLFAKQFAFRSRKFKICPNCKTGLTPSEHFLIGAILICENCNHSYAKTKQGLCLIG